MNAGTGCPRCGGPFTCGADDGTTCACFAVRLTEAARAVLRAQYSGCVCPGCLREVQAACTDDTTAPRQEPPRP